MDNPNFEDIRPYTDEELPNSLKNLVEDESFEKISKFIYPDKDVEEVKKMLLSIKTVEELQKKVSLYVVSQILKKTSTSFTYEGLENYKNNHLIISNHRDIVLDSALLQKVLVENNFPTTQITAGSNLTENVLFEQISKMNKMFTLFRGGGRIEMYKNALLHSQYIHYVLEKKKESLWIAQRDGRTKDGTDKTQQGLIKMLIGQNKNIIDSLKSLNIIPMSISYEFEPCAPSKVKQIYISQHTDYVKKKGEDMKNVVNGMLAFKGGIHLAFGKPLNPFLEQIENTNLSDNAIVEKIVAYIDGEIYRTFKFWPNNYIAYDYFYNNKFSHKYTKEQKDKFYEYVENTINNININDKEELKTILIRIYANPVINYFSFKDFS